MFFFETKGVPTSQYQVYKIFLSPGRVTSIAIFINIVPINQRVQLATHLRSSSWALAQVTPLLMSSRSSNNKTKCSNSIRVQGES